MYDGILVFDCETGGLDAIKNGLCSVTLKVKGNEKKMQTIFLKPEEGMEYHPTALEVNGLTLEKLREVGITPEEAIAQIKNFISENFGYSRPFALGHNVKFDVTFLDALFARYHIKPFSKMVDYHLMDTMHFAQLLHHSGIKRHTRFKLSVVYKELFGKDFDNAHTSEADVLATEKIFDKQVLILKDMKKLALQTINDKNGREETNEFDS